MANLRARSGLGLDLREDRALDHRHLAFDLFEALGGLALQQGRGQSASAVLGGGPVFPQGFAGEMKLLELEQDFGPWRPGLQFQQCAHASQKRRIQTVGLRQRADSLGEAARLTGLTFAQGTAATPSVRSKAR